MEKHHTPGQLPSGKPMPYRVPDNFFDDFEARLGAALEREEPVRRPDAEVKSLMPRRRTFRPVLWFASGIAAAVALLLTALPLRHSFSTQPPITAEQAFSQLSESDREMIMDDYNYMFSTDDGTF